MGARDSLRQPRGVRSPIRVLLLGRRSPTWCIQDRSPNRHLHSPRGQRGSSSDTEARGRSRAAPQRSLVLDNGPGGPPRSAASTCLFRWAIRPTRGRGSEVDPGACQGRSPIAALDGSGETASGSAVPRWDRLSRSEWINPLAPWEGRSAGSNWRPRRSRTSTCPTSCLVRPRPPKDGC
ncbi:hypothetical protein NDU88_007607 [Pleurodeles waltl]|uniref:Uncharacterized protein n=1 Tax=Pleurodeles waltl TaxID=8319 RepID=A0AAV7VST0_PLEWA|nr:hypothetical protein NDU88_007607 [Pleurodeles waltl]